MSEEKTNYVKKHLTITDDQDKYIEKECINLSKLVQKTLKEKMDKDK